ncbi:MAG: hypothetical protein HYV02_05815 [Deltaproteobacteria bacterium]|nr:hypothetical protein [Deltaproteobacteria bacterium]
MRSTVFLLVVLTIAGWYSGGCRDRRPYAGPEALILDATPVDVEDLLQLTVKGMVTCPTCPHASSSMILEVYSQQSFADGPIAQFLFPFVGAYEISVNVRYGETLTITARIFTDGGVRTASEDLVTPDDENLEEAFLTLDLKTE